STVRFCLPGGLPGRGGGRSGLAARPRVRRVRLAGSLARRILIHAYWNPLRALYVHATHARPRAVPGRRAHDGLAVLHLPRLRLVLPGPRRARRPGAVAAGNGGAGRRAHDGARRRDRSTRGARRPVVSRQPLLLPGAWRLLRRSVVELRGVGDRRHDRRRPLPRFSSEARFGRLEPRPAPGWYARI